MYTPIVSGHHSVIGVVEIHECPNDSLIQVGTCSLEATNYCKFCNVGFLSSRHGASSGCGEMRRPPDMGVAGNILNKQSQTAEDWWFSRLGLGVLLTTRRKNDFVAKCHTVARAWTRSLDERPKLRKMI
jgi:hypothetical protein